MFEQIFGQKKIRLCFLRNTRRILSNSPGWARTSDLAVNSRSLYQLSYGGINCETKISLYLPSVKSSAHFDSSLGIVFVL